MADEDTLKDYDEEMEKLFSDIRSGLTELKPNKKGKSKLTDSERNSKIAYINSRISRCKQVLRSYKVDLRSLDKTAANPYEVKATEYKETINTLIQDLNWVQENELLGGQGAKRNLDSMTSDEVIDVAKKTQDASLKSLEQTLITIDNSKQVAADTASKLHEQTEKLKHIDEGVSEIQTNLKMAAKQLRSFARRVATDKLIMVFIVLIILAVIFVIIWTSLHKNAKTSLPPGSTFTAPNITTHL